MELPEEKLPSLTKWVDANWHPKSEPDIGGLYRLGGVLEALGDSFERLPSPPKPEESVPFVGKLQRVYLLVLDLLDKERGDQLRVLVGLKYLETNSIQGPMARSTLAAMRGFVRGCIAELEADAQQAANAVAYAQAKVREERGIGFRPGDDHSSRRSR